MPRGGARDGAGRPPGPTGNERKKRSIRLSDEEYEAVRAFIKQYKKEHLNRGE